MKELLTTSKKCICLLLLMVCLGYAGIVVVYALPERTIIFNASASTDFMVSEYVSKEMEWMNWPDFYTDMVMLNIASYSDGSKGALYRAAVNEKIGHTAEDSYPFEIVGWLSERTPIEKVYYTFEEASASAEAVSYGKYWNGYLIFLRPLLLYFNMRQIYLGFRYLLALNFAVTVIVLFLRDKRFVIPFALAFLSLRPFSKFCLTYAIVDILLCCFLCASAFLRPKRNAVSEDMFFFGIGVIAIYFTLMSFSFIIPIFCSVYLGYSVKTRESKEGRWITSVKHLFWYTAGFVAMWVCKWILLAVADRSLLGKVLLSVKQRLSHDDYGEKVSLGEALLWNGCGFYYQNKALVISALVVALASVITVVMYIHLKRTNRNFENMSFVDGVLVTAVVTVATVVRYAIVLNHSRVHYFFMNRLFAGPVFAILSVCLMNVCHLFGLMRKRQVIS